MYILKFSNVPLVRMLKWPTLANWALNTAVYRDDLDDGLTLSCVRLNPGSSVPGNLFDGDDDDGKNFEVVKMADTTGTGHKYTVLLNKNGVYWQ